MRFLRQLSAKELKDKICLLRVDFNVESNEDSFRIAASIPTIKYLLKKKARVVLLSHKGRPIQVQSSKLKVKSLGSKYDFYNFDLSLKFALPILKKHLKTTIKFLDKIPEKLPKGKLFLLENLRFWKGEEANDREFAKRLAVIGDFYINDAFAVCHRANASVTQLPKLLPACSGLLLEKELANLSGVMKSPKKPLVVIFGGAKIADKTPAIKNLLKKSDRILLGSAAVNNGKYIPISEKIIHPIDWLGEEYLALDIGSLTLEWYLQELKKAKTIIWNGPLGKFEDKKYAKGSIIVANVIAESKAFSLAGGGETTQLITELGLEKKFSFLSTGGGAMLEFLSGKKLPGIEALK